MSEGVADRAIFYRIRHRWIVSEEVAQPPAGWQVRVSEIERGHELVRYGISRRIVDYSGAKDGAICLDEDQSGDSCCDEG